MDAPTLKRAACRGDHGPRRPALACGHTFHGADRAELGAVQPPASVDPRDQHRGSRRPGRTAGHEADAADPRLARARHRFAAEGAHGVDFRRAGHAADPARVLLRGAVPEQGHRQLVQRRDPQEPRRRAGAVALGARSADARAPGRFRNDRRGNRHRRIDQAGAARNHAAAGRRDRAHGGHRERPRHLREQGAVVGRRAGGRARRSAAAVAAGTALREPRAAAERRLPDPHGSVDR